MTQKARGLRDARRPTQSPDERGESHGFRVGISDGGLLGNDGGAKVASGDKNPGSQTQYYPPRDDLNWLKTVFIIMQRLYTNCGCLHLASEFRMAWMESASASACALSPSSVLHVTRIACCVRSYLPPSEPGAAHVASSLIAPRIMALLKSPQICNGWPEGKPTPPMEIPMLG